MEGFADVEQTKIMVFYPKDGVSAVQEAQMVTQEGANGARTVPLVAEQHHVLRGGVCEHLCPGASRGDLGEQGTSALLGRFGCNARSSLGLARFAIRFGT